jgi:hypothetical protein
MIRRWHQINFVSPTMLELASSLPPDSVSVPQGDRRSAMGRDPEQREGPATR